MSENMTPETGNAIPEAPKTETGFGEPEVTDASAVNSIEVENAAENEPVVESASNGEVVPNETVDNVQNNALESMKPQPSYYQYNPQTDTYVEPEQPKGSGLAIAGMVCGIVALVLVCCFWPLGIVLGIVGLILSIIALNKKQSKGMSVAGIVTSGLGILLGVALGILSVVFVSAIADVYEDPAYQEYLEYELYDSYYDDDYYEYEYYYDDEYFIFEDLREL